MASTVSTRPRRTDIIAHRGRRSNLFAVPRERTCLNCQTLTTDVVTCRRCCSSYCSESCKKEAASLHICKFNYHVYASLINVKDPEIIRMLLVPSMATFEELHQALQIAFSWRPGTDYEFYIGNLKGLRTLITPSSRKETLVWRWSNEENVPYDDYKDGETTYIAEAMEDLLIQGRRILAYKSDVLVPDQLAHRVIITCDSEPPLRGLARSDIICTGGEGHPFAEGFSLDGWQKLKRAYRAEHPTAEQTALVELYELFCPNANLYGLRHRLGHWDRKAVNARLDKLPIGSTNVPERIQRVWIGLENEELSANEHSVQEEPLSLLEQAFGAFSL